MSATERKNPPIFDPGLCRCCGNMTQCRVLNEKYEEKGLEEVYSEMMKTCFGLEFSYLNNIPMDRLICNLCVKKLREALNFKIQVIQNEQAFLQSKMLETFSDSKIDCSTDVAKTVMEDQSDIVGADVNVTSDGLNSKIDCSTDVAKTVIKDQSDIVGADVNVISDGFDDEIRGCLLEEYYSTVKMVDKDLDEPCSQEKSFILNNTEKQHSSAHLLSKITKINTKSCTKARKKLKLEQTKRWQQATNTTCIVKYSYVCPFSNKFNHILCYYCNHYFVDSVSLREHVWSHNPEEFKTKCRYIKLDLTRIDCRLCSERINDLDVLKRHLVAEHGKHCFLEVKNSILPFKLRDVNKCTLCGVEFSYFYALVKHMNHHYSNYVCETCGAGFPERRTLLTHASTHADARLPCVHCGATFKSHYTRKEHVQKVHKKDEPTSFCTKCEASFPPSERAKHMAELHGESPTITCSACDQVFNSRQSLSLHVRRAHLKVFRYQCDVCQKKFYCQSSLNNHMPTHTGERNYKCKVCEKTYPRLKTLKEHMRIHTNDRRYRCHLCGQAFIQNCSLKGHMRSKHL